MFNILTHNLPNEYRGHEINTSFKVALRIQELLDDPRLKRDSSIERTAAYMVAVSLLYKEEDILKNKLSLQEAISGVFWWLSCGDTDKVERYWRKNKIVPDIDDNAFDIKDYNAVEDDYIDIETTDDTGKKTTKKVTRYSILAFDAPDNTTRYFKRANGDPDVISLYEDNSLIYSGFYKIYGIDLASEDLHWFKFCWLLSELEMTEGTAIYEKIRVRSFNPADYKGKQYDEYRSKMSRIKNDNRVLGILPYKDGGN